MSALLAHIDFIIKKRGPISVADYMELALQHPEHGYYRKGDPLGQSGDFVTAPEISQMFGEMIGLWCADVWKQMGSPEAFALLELGPGRGTLMQDALRATAKINGFHAAMNLCLLESNETLRGMQMEKLAAYEPVFLEDVGELNSLLASPPRRRGPISPSLSEETDARLRGHDAEKGTPTIIIANEFFDALPVRQFEKTFQGWCERSVAVEDHKLHFVFTPMDASLISIIIPAGLREGLPGTVHEVSLPALTLMRDMTQHVVQQTGAALIIDYGYVTPPGKPTLQAVAGHIYTDVLDRPGEVDVTAHVDFGAFKNTVSANGGLPLGPIGQGEFLQTLGIELRADQLKRTATPEQAKAIDAGLRRLIDPSQMGSLFKVMGVAAAEFSELPGF